MAVVVELVEGCWGIFLLFLTQAAAEDIPLSFGAGADLFLFLLDFSRRSLRELFILAVAVVSVVLDVGWGVGSRRRVFQKQGRD